MTPYYDDGTCVIYHGDCTEVDLQVSASALITDPPYGIGMDDFTDDFESGVVGVRLARSKRAAVFHSPRRMVEFVAAVEGGGRGDEDESIGEPWVFERALWMHKTADIAAPWRGWCMNSEVIVVLSRDRVGWPLPNSYRSDTYTVGPWERAGHPNGKPLTVVRDLVSRLSSVGEVVLDPFMGSGTTLRAAKDLNRRAIGIEIEERYCEIAAKRLAQEVLDFGGAA